MRRRPPCSLLERSGSGGASSPSPAFERRTVLQYRLMTRRTRWWLRKKEGTNWWRRRWLGPATRLDTTEEDGMTTNESSTPNRSALIQHLARFPEDLRDIRRLQRRF